MFGTRRKREREARRLAELEAAAIRAANQRPNLLAAVKEVLSGNGSTRVWVGDVEISSSGQGSGSCSVVWTRGSSSSLPAIMHWHSSQNLAKQLGRRYDVSLQTYATVEVPSFSLLMDLASVYPNPRSHAVEYRNELVSMRTEAEFEKHKYDTRHSSTWWSIVRF